MTKYYPSPRISGEYLDCSLPVTLDTYSSCSYDCLYCFSYFQKSKRIGPDYQKHLEIVNEDMIKKMFLLQDDIPCFYKNFQPFIKERRVIQWGGLGDQFDMNEKKHGVTLRLLEFFHKINYPICFSTKATWWVYDDRYMKLFSSQENWNTKISIINLDEKLSRRVERGCPTPDERLAAMAELSKISPGGVTLRLRPFIIGVSERNGEYLELIKRAKSAGATAVSTEFLCLENRNNDGSLERFCKLSKILGFDILDFYRKYSVTKGYLRLNKVMKSPYIYAMHNLCDKLGLRFYVSDAHFKELCHNGCCCGLPPEWNYSRGQFTEALMKAKNKGCVTWDDMESDVNILKNVPWNGNVNPGTTMRLMTYHNYSLYDWMKSRWNSPRLDASPYRYFNGALVPVGLDDKKNVIYKYAGEK